MVGRAGDVLEYDNVPQLAGLEVHLRAFPVAVLDFGLCHLGHGHFERRPVLQRLVQYASVCLGHAFKFQRFELCNGLLVVNSIFYG